MTPVTAAKGGPPPGAPVADGPLCGASLADGIGNLRAAGVEPWWYARSMFLCNACAEAEPLLGFAPSGGPPVSPGGSRRAVVFGFLRDEGMQAWAYRNSAIVAMPASGLTSRLGDKTHLPELARDAGVATPRSVVRTSARADEAERMWRELGAREAVIQIGHNDLTGAGTRLVASPAALAAELACWEGHPVKLAAFVRGLPITVSGVVLSDDLAVASGISMQLVGYPELTPVWAAHCGNQLLDDAQLMAGVGAAARETCRRLGVTLGRSGFRGMYGIDAVVTDAGVVVLEINPRVQSVTSLISSAELASGLLPSPLLHVSAFAGAPWPRSCFRSEGPVPPFGQLVVGALEPGWIRTAPRTGLYQLAGPDAVCVGGTAPLGTLRPDQALVWAFAARGSRVREADRLFVMQTPEPVASCPDGALTAATRAWLAALHRQTVLDPAESPRPSHEGAIS